jgi:hypothetical protein
MGMGGDVPTTPQQAMRAELPGSPEYESAKAKGLDMSQAGRMARAKEMGFDTETVLYHGTQADITAFRPSKDGTRGKGVYLTPSSSAAEGYAKAEGTILPTYVRGRIFPDEATDAMSEADYQAIFQAASKPQQKQLKAAFEGEGAFPKTYRRVIRSIADNETAINALLQKAGFTGRSGRSRITGDEEVMVFDPSNIRSVNAAFDPDNAASPQLLAGFGKDLLTAGAAGATIGGAMIARDEMLDQPRDNALAVPEPSPAPINPNMPRNAVARTYGAPQAPLSEQDPDDPRNFGVESFEDLRPNDPLRDPWFRREMIQRGMRYQANEKPEGVSRTVGKPKEKRTVGKAGAN